MKPLPRFLGLLLLVVSTASAQEWPARPVRIIVPFPAGGSADLMPRIVAEKLSEKWGQPVIVENRPGAAGNIGADIVFRSEPDGYTLLSAPPPPLVINRLLYPKLSYDSTQFVPVTVIAANPNVLLVHPRLGVNSVAELIALARQNPGKLNYASQGSGSTSHLTAELFKSMAGGLQVTHVPYKGTAPALTDIMNGQIAYTIETVAATVAHVKSGRLKALGVSFARRSAAMPDVPPLAEAANLPGFDVGAWIGYSAPAGTPREVLARLSGEIQKAMQAQDLRERYLALGLDPVANTPDEMMAFLRTEQARYGEIVRKANIKVE